MSLLSKEESIRDVVARLWSDLGGSSFEIMDHWDADRRAIGIASPGDRRQLVYIAALDGTRDRYYYECERASDTVEYEVVEEREGADYPALLDAVRRHLRVS